MQTLLSQIEQALEGRHNSKCIGGCDCGRDLILEGLLEMAASDLRVQADEDATISQHIGWLKQFISGMDENNWRDMRLQAARQLDEMSSVNPKYVTAA